MLCYWLQCAFIYVKIDNADNVEVNNLAYRAVVHIAFSAEDYGRENNSRANRCRVSIW